MIRSSCLDIFESGFGGQYRAIPVRTFILIGLTSSISQHNAPSIKPQLPYADYDSSQQGTQVLYVDTETPRDLRATNISVSRFFVYAHRI